ncbi:hypothetical protein B5F76_01440 [Desulfovibrio sp. An276]|uniref:hypothetical protein n=1 Tax=Desulfovibrio sp. An276 TaxID=1965618 RepID=UPI000B365A1B|nr:hypothetical protein [Desulfovibrio sp. An276]OUO55299.1 hypothetical protein B5F76_01440 [Desulfovibrio sp. An276]
MLNKIRTLIVVLILSLIAATSVFAAKYVETSVGKFMAAAEDCTLLVQADELDGNISIMFDGDGTWNLIISDNSSMVRAPVAAVVTPDGRQIAAIELRHEPVSQMWTVYSGSDGETERKFPNGTRIVTPIGSIYVTKDNNLVIRTESQDPSTITVSYIAATDTWQINEVFSE